MFWCAMFGFAAIFVVAVVAVGWYCSESCDEDEDFALPDLNEIQANQRQ